MTRLCRSGQARSGSTYLACSGIPNTQQRRVLIQPWFCVAIVVATLETLNLLDEEGFGHGLVQLRQVTLKRQPIVAP